MANNLMQLLQQYNPQRDPRNIFEVIQRDNRGPAPMQDVFDTGWDRQEMFYADDGSGEMPESLKNFLAKYGKYGLTATRHEYDPSREGDGTGVRNQAGWSTSGFDWDKLPKSAFGDLRSTQNLNSDDKNNVIDPMFVSYVPNYGWTTHRKNYDWKADMSFLQRNIGTIAPALAMMALGFPPMVNATVGLGRGVVDTLGGNKPWQSLLPSLLGMGLGLGGISGIPAQLART